MTPGRKPVTPPIAHLFSIFMHGLNREELRAVERGAIAPLLERWMKEVLDGRQIQTQLHGRRDQITATTCDHWIRAVAPRRILSTTEVYLHDRATMSGLSWLGLNALGWLHGTCLRATRARSATVIVMGLGFDDATWERGRNELRRDAEPCATEPTHTEKLGARLRWDVWTCDHQGPRGRSR